MLAAINPGYVAPARAHRSLAGRGDSKFAMTYAVCGRTTTYAYPAEAEASPPRMDGLDAVLDVPGFADVGEDLCFEGSAL